MTPPPRPARLTIAGLILGGLVVFLTGAGLASSLNVWGLESTELVKAVAGGSADAWRIGHLLLALGVVLTAAGLAALAGEFGSAAGRSGAALAIIAASIGAIAFLVQGYATLAAADIWRATGAVSSGFLVMDELQRLGLDVVYASVGMFGTALLGLGALRAGWMPPGLGAIAAGAGAVGAILILAGIDLIPAVVQFVAAILAIGVLMPARRAASQGADFAAK